MISFNQMRLDRWAALAGAAILGACAYIAFLNRYSYLVKLLPGALFWDSNVFASAGHEIAQGNNPYFAPVIDNPFPLPFISAPQVAGVLGGFAALLGPALFLVLVVCHVAALVGAPLILTRIFLGKSWQDIALGYGLFACGLGAFGVTTIIAGNFGAALYLAIFAALIPGLRENKWMWFHIAVAVAVQVKPPYALLWIVPVLVNGWSWKQVRFAAIAGAASLVPYLAAFVIDRVYFADWLWSLGHQLAAGDYGFSAYGGMIRANKSLQFSAVPMIVHASICALLFAFLLQDRTKGVRKAAALIAFAILANPRMKEYDIAFATIPVAALYLDAFLAGANDARRRAIGIGLVLALNLALLRADHIYFIGPLSFTLAIALAIFSLAYRREENAVAARS